MDIRKLLRANIAALTPYSTARDEFDGVLEVYLDANESPYPTGFNRYPDPHQRKLKQAISAIKGVATDRIFVGNGSDEPIDLLYRAFCEPRQHNVVAIAPSYGMYRVAADTNAVGVREVLLGADFALSADAVLAAVDENTRLIFLCSPNNPSGNALDKREIEQILKVFDGVVVLDEAYVDFCPEQSFLPRLAEFSNLVVLQTFSKAWAMAGLRLGMAFGDPQLIEVLSRIKYPYNINVPTQRAVIQALGNAELVRAQTREIVAERGRLERLFASSQTVKRCYPSDANFLLIEVEKPRELYAFLIACGVLVRDRSKIVGCAGCLRVTVGTPAENRRVEEVFALLDAGVPQSEIAARYNNNISVERVAEVRRTTKETDICVRLDLEGTARNAITTGLPFFDHMLSQIPHHAGFDLAIEAKGDLEVDAHHTIEDVALALGEAFRLALGSKRGVERYGFCLPMDEANASILLDFGGRTAVEWSVRFTEKEVGGIPTEMFEHFFRSFAGAAACNLHLSASGTNAHHTIEGLFKAFARSLKAAVRCDPFVATLPSSKGTL